MINKKSGSFKAYADNDSESPKRHTKHVVGKLQPESDEEEEYEEEVESEEDEEKEF